MLLKSALLAVIISILCGCLSVAQSGNRPTITGVVPLPNLLVDDGDSLSTDDGSSTVGATSLAYAQTQFSKTIRTANVGLTGAQLCPTLLPNFSSRVTPLYDPGAAVFLVHLLAGTNDIRLSGLSASAILACMQSYVNDVHALGQNAKVIVSTNFLQCDIFNNATWKASLQTLNNSIISNWNVAQSSGGLGADALANYWADPTIGPNTYASSAACGAQWSGDGQHLYEVGKQIMGGIQAATVNPLLH